MACEADALKPALRLAGAGSSGPVKSGRRGHRPSHSPLRTEASLNDAPCVNDLVEVDVCEVRFYIVAVRHQCSLKYPHNGQTHGCRCGEMSRLLLNVGSE